MTGSHATLAGWEPAACTVCGRKVRLTGPDATGWMFRLQAGVATATCAPCLTVRIERAA